MSSNNSPALALQRDVLPLPRWALWLLCALYVVSGFWGRDPWRAADIDAYAAMLDMVRSGHWQPQLLGAPIEGGWLPYALGAAFIHVGEWLAPALSPWIWVRLPFIAVMGAMMALLWYSAYHLAREDAAQPQRFALGGEAGRIDYARAMADSALLALVATLGLLQLGHEVTPQLLQLLAVTLWMYGLARAPTQRGLALGALGGSGLILAASGAPVSAVALMLGALAIAARSSHAAVRRLLLPVALLLVPVLAVAGLTGAWAWRVRWSSSGTDLLKLLIWFTWPTLPMALVTLWRWRAFVLHRHVSVPLVLSAWALAQCLAMAGDQHALLLALPGLALLAAWSLPAVPRGLTALVDWFSVCFFSVAALAIWVIYSAMHLGWPAPIAANIDRLSSDYDVPFQAWALVLGGAVTLVWGALVVWRTGRHRPALWKSMVLPAGGVGACWLMLMSLWLPVLDYGRSPRPWAELVRAQITGPACLEVGLLSSDAQAALQVYGRPGWQLRRNPLHTCDSGVSGQPVWRLVPNPSRGAAPALPGWAATGQITRPTSRADTMILYRRLSF
ncbi:hypothetical protein [Amphibiibacter pelophylacis]|uniref:Uncharacterized protein n=1 Tax=Amphibiibacter pelophylacis TaxID=1799477 RepID=A0ACC6P0A0_9BURK